MSENRQSGVMKLPKEESVVGQQSPEEGIKG